MSQLPKRQRIPATRSRGTMKKSSIPSDPVTQMPKKGKWAKPRPNVLKPRRNTKFEDNVGKLILFDQIPTQPDAKNRNESLPNGNIDKPGTMKYDLNKMMPTTFPYYIQSTAYISVEYSLEPNENLPTDIYVEETHNEIVPNPHRIIRERINKREPYAMLIKNNDDKWIYIKYIWERIFPYEGFDPSPQILRGLDSQIFSINKIPIELIRVATYKAGNCLLNLIHNAGIPIKKVYKKFPHLKPNGENPVYINHNEISSLSKILQFTLCIYSKLGAKLSQPWIEFKCKRGKRIHIEISNGHARIMPNKISINNIEYHNQITIPNDLSIVDFDYFEPSKNANDNDPLVIKYYTTLINGIFTIHKAFRPSSVTNRDIDDKDPEYKYVFTNEQMLYRLFKARYELAPIFDESIRNVVKSAEHFIKRKIFEPVGEVTIKDVKISAFSPAIGKNGVIKDMLIKRINTSQHETIKFKPDLKLIDHNKNYMSYKRSEYYMGFPTNILVPITTDYKPVNGNKILFVICHDIDNPPSYFCHLYEYSAGPITLPYPVYQYLQSQSIEISVDYYLMGQTQDIDIYEFADECKQNGWVNNDLVDLKKFTNSLAGRAISGGLSETMKMTVITSTDDELDQLIQECHSNNLRFSIQSTDNGNMSITIHYKNNNSGLFHFHSYILGYASIHIMKKWHELEANQCKVLGFNTDAIIYKSDNNYITPTGINVGEWKYENINTKSYYAKLHISDNDLECYADYPSPDRPIIYSASQLRIDHNTFINGPAGIGKSYEWITSPLYDQIYLTPTILLREAIKNGDVSFINTHTMHKYFQPQIANDDKIHNMRVRNRIPHLHKYIIIDEATMYSLEQWNIILRRSGKSILVVLGDFEQICNEASGIKVSRKYFEDNNFEIQDIVRTPDMHSRHSYDDGLILDSLRGLSISEQVDKLINENVNTAVIEDAIRKITNNDHSFFISDTHNKLHNANLAAKVYCATNNILFPVREKKNKLITRIPVDSIDIWWGRKRMNDEMPLGLKYEPAFAITPDSVQGCTIDKPLYIDANMYRQGAFYTAATRTRKLSDIYLVYSDDDIQNGEYDEPQDIDAPTPKMQMIKFEKPNITKQMSTDEIADIVHRFLVDNYMYKDASWLIINPKIAFVNKRFYELWMSIKNQHVDIKRKAFPISEMVSSIDKIKAFVNKELLRYPLVDRKEIACGMIEFTKKEDTIEDIKKRLRLMRISNPTDEDINKIRTNYREELYDILRSFVTSRYKEIYLDRKDDYDSFLILQQFHKGWSIINDKINEYRRNKYTYIIVCDGKIIDNMTTIRIYAKKSIQGYRNGDLVDTLVLPHIRKIIDPSIITDYN
jgi:hypothetical protein